MTRLFLAAALGIFVISAAATLSELWAGDQLTRIDTAMSAPIASCQGPAEAGIER